MKVQSATELAKMVEENPQLQEEIKADPVRAIANLATPLQSDTLIYRMVVASLGLVALISITGAMYLANTPAGVPDAVISLGSAAVGAMASLLAPSHRR